MVQPQPCRRQAGGATPPLASASAGPTRTCCSLQAQMTAGPGFERALIWRCLRCLPDTLACLRTHPTATPQALACAMAASWRTPTLVPHWCVCEQAQGRADACVDGLVHVCVRWCGRTGFRICRAPRSVHACALWQSWPKVIAILSLSTKPKEEGMVACLCCSD